MGGSFETPATDFLDAQLGITGVIVTCTVPVFTVNFIRSRIFLDWPDDPGRKCVDYQHIFTMVQSLSAFYLTFVGFTKSPQWAGIGYIKIAPIIHLVVTVGSLLVIPILVVFQTAAMTQGIEQSVYTGPLLIYPFISLCQIVQFPFIIVPRIRHYFNIVQDRKADMLRWHELKTAREKGTSVEPMQPSINSAEEKLLETEGAENEEERLHKKLFTGLTKAPYCQYDRDPGCGPLRIGEHLLLGEDMYSLLFVSFFNWELVKKCNEENEETEHLKEKMLKQFAKAHKERERASLDKKSTMSIMKNVLKKQIEEERDAILDKMVADETDEDHNEELTIRQQRIRNLISGHSIQRADYIA
jgi:hypothetical protein